MTNITRLSDSDLYRATRRALQARPEDAQSRQENISALNALAHEIRARLERRQQQETTP
jgi:hypothetical protein